MMQSCRYLRTVFQAMVGAKTLSPDQREAMSACCHEATEESRDKEGIFQVIASSQHFLEGQKFVTASFTAEIITFLKGALDNTYEAFLLPDIARVGTRRQGRFL